MAELLMLRPLFASNSDVDQFNRISGVLGNPFVESQSKEPPLACTAACGIGGSWKEGAHLANRLGFSFPVVCLKNEGLI